MGTHGAAQAAGGAGARGGASGGVDSLPGHLRDLRLSGGGRTDRRESKEPVRNAPPPSPPTPARPAPSLHSCCGTLAAGNTLSHGWLCAGKARKPVRC